MKCKIKLGIPMDLRFVVFGEICVGTTRNAHITCKIYRFGSEKIKSLTHRQTY